MLKTVYTFALPGGRRLFVAYTPPEQEREQELKPQPRIEPPNYDRIFAQAGLHFDIPVVSRQARGKRTR